MSNMTNRLSDSQLADIAKQRYETQQQNQIPGVVVDLPSRGLVYPKSSVLREGIVNMRYMTAYDEDILTNRNYIERGIVFDKLLESVITTPGFKVSELVEGDKSWLIIMVRVTSYDSKYPVQVKTPTGELISTYVDLSKLEFKPFNLTPDDNGEFEFHTSHNNVLKFKFLSSNIINNTPTESRVSYILQNAITQINEIRDKNKILEWMKYSFLRKESAEFRQYIIEHTPDVNTICKFEYKTNEGNMETFESTFPIRSDFFWI